MRAQAAGQVLLATRNSQQPSEKLPGKLAGKLPAKLLRKLITKLGRMLARMLVSMLAPMLRPLHRDKLFTLLCAKLDVNLAPNLERNFFPFLDTNPVQHLVSFLGRIPVQFHRRNLPRGQSLVHPLHGEIVIPCRPGAICCMSLLTRLPRGNSGPARRTNGKGRHEPPLSIARSCYYFFSPRTMNSTRRLSARPASVLFVAIGMLLP